MAGDDGVIGGDPFINGMNLSIRLRRDFTVTDADRLLATARRTYRELNPAASAKEACEMVSCAADALFVILEHAGLLGDAVDSRHQCLNLPGARKVSGNVIQFWAHTRQGEPNNDWNMWIVGKVNCTTGFPFGGFVSQATCVNWGYHNKYVVKIAFAPNGTGSGWCLDMGTYPDQPPIATGDDPVLELDPRSPPNETTQAQMFVLTPLKYLVAALPTAIQFLPAATINVSSSGPATG